MHAHLFHLTPFAGDAVEIADQQQSQWNFRIDRGSARGLQKSFSSSGTKPKST